MNNLIDELDLNNELYIYYLELESRPDMTYIHLAADFKELGITMVPINSSELDHFMRRGQLPLIVITDTLSKLQKFTRFRQEYLDYALRTNNILIFHLSSFGKPYSILAFEKKNTYIPVPLPIKTNDIMSLVLKEYFAKKVEQARWPGGRRSKLPTYKD